MQIALSQYVAAKRLQESNEEDRLGIRIMGSREALRGLTELMLLSYWFSLTDLSFLGTESEPLTFR
jgi:hypothetical protein